MEDTTKQTKQENQTSNILPFSIIIAAVILAGTWLYISETKPNAGNKNNQSSETVTGENTDNQADYSLLEEKLFPSEGVVLPVNWNDLGMKMVNDGVIDKAQFESLYEDRGGLSEETKRLLEGSDNEKIKITAENSGTLLNLFWALGLGNKNDILEKGPMMDSTYGGAGNFASTGGWTLAVGDVMDHYSRHQFIVLTPEQQKLVEDVSKNIYRPCCGNSTYFPDCNHGMAMLGLLELMASQGVSEQEMYKVALQVNIYWFPDTYLTIAQYLKSKNIEWEKADPKEILGVNYSSSSGYRQILNQTTPASKGGGGGCGV